MPECQICEKPLGADSISMNYKVCQEHRRCPACAMSIPPREVDYCLDHSLPIKHMRCLTATDGSPANHSVQSNIDRINYALLQVEPAELIKDMTFDQRYAFLQRLQSLAAEVSILLRKDKKHFEERLRDEERQERESKHKPKPQDPIKKAAALGIVTTSEKVARKKLSDRDKAVAAIMKLTGISREAAEASLPLPN